MLSNILIKTILSSEVRAKDLILIDSGRKAVLMCDQRTLYLDLEIKNSIGGGKHYMAMRTIMLLFFPEPIGMVPHLMIKSIVY
jgi:hypothetical protein